MLSCVHFYVHVVVIYYYPFIFIFGECRCFFLAYNRTLRKKRKKKERCREKNKENEKMKKKCGCVEAKFIARASKSNKMNRLLVLVGYRCPETFDTLCGPRPFLLSFVGDGRSFSAQRLGCLVLSLLWCQYAVSNPAWLWCGYQDTWQLRPFAVCAPLYGRSVLRLFSCWWCA